MRLPLLNNYFKISGEGASQGIYSFSYALSQGIEERAFSLMANMILESLEIYSEKRVIISVDSRFHQEQLITFLNTISPQFAERVNFISNYTQLPAPEDENVGGFFIFNSTFFYDLRESEFSSSAINILRQTYSRHRNQRIVVFSPTRREIGGDSSAILSNQGQAMLSQLIIHLSPGKEKKEVIFNIIKCRHNPTRLNFSLVEENFSWRLPSNQLADGNNFFKIYDLSAHLLNQGMLLDSTYLPQEFNNIDEIFTYFKTSKKIKKIIIDNSIKTQKNFNENTLGIITIDFTLVNLYLFMKYFFQTDFDPNFFISEAPGWKFRGFNFKGNWAPAMKLLKDLTTQKKFYKFLDPHSREFWDLVLMIETIRTSNMSFSFPKKTNTLLQAHDALSLFLEERDPKAQIEIKVQLNKQNWAMSEHELYNEKDEKKKFTVLLPLTGRDFLTLGKKMKICVKNQWFWSLLEENKHNLIVLAKGRELKYCVQFNERREIVQAKGVANQDIDPSMLAQIATLVENLP